MLEAMPNAEPRSWLALAEQAAADDESAVKINAPADSMRAVTAAASAAACRSATARSRPGRCLATGPRRGCRTGRRVSRVPSGRVRRWC